MWAKLLVLLLCLASCSGGQDAAKKSTMSHEEEVVRTVYAKLACAAQIGAAWHAMERGDGRAEVKDRLAPQKAADSPSFELSDFTVGDLQRVATEPWTSLIAGPVGVLNAWYRELTVQPAGEGSKADRNIIYSDLSWNVSPQLQESVAQTVPKNKRLTLTEFVRGLRQPGMRDKWERYASYSVVARLGERSISYRATFLFSGQDAAEEILPLDYATAMTISPFVKARICPAVVASTVFHGEAVLEAGIVEHEACRWVNAHAGSCLQEETAAPRKVTSAVISNQIETQYGIVQCKKTVEQLPKVCPAAERVFSTFAGTLVNTTMSDSQMTLTCSWICTQHSTSGWQVQYGPWALDSIGLSPIDRTPRTTRDEVKNDQNL